MKILLYTMYFHPEPVGIAPMATALADYLAARDWEVTVVAGMPKLPAWRVYGGYRGKWMVRERRGPARVIRTWVYVPENPKTGLMKASRRILHDSSIAATGFPAALLAGRPDMILSITPPLQLALAAIALKKLWACPLVNWVQDIVPDAALNLRMMREGIAMRIARGLERLVYQSADRIAVISPGFQDNLASKGVDPKKLVLLTNWADVAQFDIASERERYRSQLGGRARRLRAHARGQLRGETGAGERGSRHEAPRRSQ